MAILFAVEVVLHIPTYSGQARAQRAVYITPVVIKDIVGHMEAAAHRRIGANADCFIAFREVGQVCGICNDVSRLGVTKFVCLKPLLVRTEQGYHIDS
jgi:hypothetical protein